LIPCLDAKMVKQIQAHML